MKLEQVRKYEVRRFYEPEEKDAIVDEKGNVLYSSCIGDDEFYPPSEEDYFFDTKEDADKFYSKLMSKIDIEAIKEYIEFLWDKGRLEEILPKRVYEILKNGTHLFCISYEEREQIRNALNGILNINATSFRVSDVACIEYGKDWLLVKLKNGTNVVPTNDTEIFIIESIFGDNPSGMVRSDLNKP